VTLTFDLYIYLQTGPKVIRDMGNFPSIMWFLNFVILSSVYKHGLTDRQTGRQADRPTCEMQSVFSSYGRAA